jgi:hypothetical protein
VTGLWMEDRGCAGTVTTQYLLDRACGLHERWLDDERSNEQTKGNLENMLLSLELSGSNELFYCESW